jgi:hypothetical protein
MQKHFLLLSTLLLSLAVIIAPPYSAAYEVDTHEDMSEAAAEQSANLGAALPLLGLTSLEDRLVFLPAQGAVMKAKEWIRFGSKEEDELFQVGSPIAIFRHHFFNPLNGSGLYYVPRPPCNAIAITGTPSPNWALGQGMTQDYSFPAARTALHKALTEQSATEREKNLALMFRILGHVIHHIQDMAQPQHTRNDPHGPGCLGVEGGGFYEEYTNRPLVRGSVPFLSLLLPGNYEPVYKDTDTTTFNAPRQFWTTPEGKGIADYSNRGFVSTGTNFDKSGLFSSPVLGPGWQEDQTALCNQINMPRPSGPNGQPLPCVMTFVETPVDDAYRPGNEVNRKASTYSIFNADLTIYNKTVTYTDPATGQTFTTPTLYTLNHFNFDAAHQFLIPRAVGYSAGLINYFFRGVGKLGMKVNPQADSYLITNTGMEDLEGTFSLYYDSEDGTRTLVQNTTWPTAGAGEQGSVLRAGESMPVPLFVPPFNPLPKTPGQYILVFTGRMGEERVVGDSVGAIAVQQVKLPYPSFLLFKAGGTYRSKYLDQGWERISENTMLFDAGQAVTDELIFVNGWPLVLHSESGLYRSTDGGRSFTAVEIPGEIYTVLGGTYLGGKGLVGTAYGNKWFLSTDLGVSWTEETLAETMHGLSLIGEGVLFGGYGSEFYRSVDQGRTWQPTTLTVGGEVLRASESGDDRSWIPKTVVWNQRRENQILLAPGILYIGGSGDGGGGSNELLGQNSDNGGSGVLEAIRRRLRDQMFNSDKIWRAQSEGTAASNHTGLWKSVDGGNTWYKIETGSPMDASAWWDDVRVKVALAPQGQALLAAAATESGVQPAFVGLHRSEDGGETWQPATDPEPGTWTFGIIYLGNHLWEGEESP